VSQAIPGRASGASRAPRTETRAGLERWALPAALVLTALGVARRLMELRGHWLNPDEGVNYAAATAPSWAEFWREVAWNAHPPLFYLVERIAALASFDPFFLRLPSVLLGGVTIFACFLCARRLSGPAAGVVAAALAAFAPALVIHSELIRPYMLQLAALFSGLWLLLRWLDARRTGDLVGCGALWLAAVLTHYSSALVVAAAGLGVAGLVALRSLPLRELPRLSLAFAPSLAGAGLLWALHARHLAGGDLESAARVQYGQFLAGRGGDLLPSLVGVHRYLFGSRVDLLATLLCAVGLASFVVRRSFLLPLLAAGAFGAAAVLSLGGRYPFGSTRHSLYLAVAIVPALAEALRLLLFTRLRVALVAAPALGLLAYAAGPLRRELGVRPSPIAIEKSVTTEVALRNLARFDRARSEPRVVILDLETWYSVIPYLRMRGDPPPESVGDPPIRRLRWGASDILVSNAWTLVVHPIALDAPEHVVGFQRRADATFPELGLQSRSDGLLLFAGFTAHRRRPFRALNQRLGGPPCFSEVQVEPGFGAARVDFSRCLRASALRRPPAGAPATGS
jgi:hypothetical protein